MKTIKVIRIDYNEMDYIQFLNFEMESYQKILGYILLEKTKGYEYSKENYEHFMDEYKEAHMKYSLAVLDLLDKYAPAYKGKDEYRVKFDFDLFRMAILGEGDEVEN